MIFQRSLNTGQFPKIWKVSRLQPIFKSGDRSDIANYRGISIISAIPKLFEAMLTDEICQSFKDYIIPEQYSFFGGRSAATNLAVYQDFLITSVEKGHQIDTIYTDLSKAFDSVCHTLLLKKLSEIGISGNYLAWISSYLQDRSQWVEICGSRSGEVLATSGVPQGSHMGPVLFSLFINDVKSCFRSSKILLYADDLKMYGRVQPGGDYLQSDLDRFVYWCSENFLKINVAKCKAISFYKTVNPYNTGYVINGEPVQAVFDRNLSFNLHINNITLKGLRLLGFIKRNTKYMTDIRGTSEVPV